MLGEKLNVYYPLSRPQVVDNRVHTTPTIATSVKISSSA